MRVIFYYIIFPVFATSGGRGHLDPHRAWSNVFSAVRRGASLFGPLRLASAQGRLSWLPSVWRSEIVKERKTHAAKTRAKRPRTTRWGQKQWSVAGMKLTMYSFVTHFLVWSTAVGRGVQCAYCKRAAATPFPSAGPNVILNKNEQFQRPGNKGNYYVAHTFVYLAFHSRSERSEATWVMTNPIQDRQPA